MEESRVQFASWEEASKAGKLALNQFLQTTPREQPRCERVRIEAARIIPVPILPLRLVVARIRGEWLRTEAQYLA